MRMSFLRMMAVGGLVARHALNKARHRTAPSSLLKPLSASPRLCGLHFSFGLAALFILFVAQPARLQHRTSLP